MLAEPTAALDPGKRALVLAPQTEREKRVLSVIVHRLSPIRIANRICVVADGRIVESGCHGDLMQNPSGVYQRFIELQLG